MISICIPTYEQKGQGPNMLFQLLRSIAKQKFNDTYEIVISDNSMNDGVKSVCKQFPTLPINYYHNQVRGASENINNAIDLAKYDKIKLMMQDDLFNDPFALHKFSEALDYAGWVISDSIHINGSGLKTGQRIAQYNPNNFDTNTVGMPSVIAFRKSELRFDPRLKTFCDVYFYYRLYQKHDMPAKIPGFNIAQRFHDASLSRNQPPSHKQDKMLLIVEGKIPIQPPKVVVAVVVHKRWDNIQRWLSCWAQCNTYNAELVIIINSDNGQPVESFYRESYATGVKFIHRPNIGYDIGAFQDVCRQRLHGFPDYDYLLWCTDDTIPMDKDFINAFLVQFEKHIGLTCMQISNEVTRHVRTTGFCIRKDVAGRLKFPADPITTIQQCLHFEHRGGLRTLMKQVEAMRLYCLQVTPDFEKAPLYDMGFWTRNEQARKVAHLHDRMEEHRKIFPILEKTAHV